MRAWHTLVVSIVVGVAAGCGGAGGTGDYGPTTPTGQTPTGTTPASSNTVTVADISFSPAAMTVPVGATVTWSWVCQGDGYGTTSTCSGHNVTFDDGSGIASPTQTTGTFTRTFATAGSFKYHCSIHGAAAMSGTITVQ